MLDYLCHFGKDITEEVYDSETEHAEITASITKKNREAQILPLVKLSFDAGLFRILDMRFIR